MDAADPALVIVSLGVDTFVDDPMCDLALTTDGFARIGAAVAALGRPLVVLQEGGYADAALGANVSVVAARRGVAMTAAESARAVALVDRSRADRTSLPMH